MVSVARGAVVFPSASSSAGATALAFAYVALVGLFLLALFPVRPCSQRLAPGRGWPHALGSLLFFFSGDGLLGTLLIACDDEGAYGGMNEAALAAQRAEAEGNGSFKRSNGDQVYEL